MEKNLGLIPVNDCVLVELGREHANLGMQTREGKYDTRTNGVVVAVRKTNRKEIDAIIKGKKIYFEEYKEGARIKRDGKIYCFIKIEDIRGYEEA